MTRLSNMVFAVAMLTSSFVNAADLIDFATQVQPILSEHCFQCHGPDEGSREADLRLDQRSDSFEARSILVTATPDDSELLQRVTSTNADEVMPPPDHGRKLDEAEIAILRKWISEGGKYAKHWAFESPVKSSTPQDRNPIDALIEARLQADGHAPSQRERPEVLCRRIYLDVTGLPPTIEQLDTYLEATTKSLQTATIDLVNKLLSDTAYGEKWARHWLDVARYSDTNGFEKDLPREQWAWRDWTIAAINSDKPYNEFVIEQIAGDLLPEATQDQIVATGFLRNGMVNEEGAIIPEQFRIEGNFDRMDCIGRSIMGLTFQCAQCHTHKFDPISHDEYYGMYAFLNNTYESQAWVYSETQLKSIAEIKQKIAAEEASIKTQILDWETRLATWSDERKSEQASWHGLHVEEPILEGGLNHPTSLPDDSILTLGHPTTHGIITLNTTTTQPIVSEIRLEALQHGDLPFEGPGRSHLGTFAISEFSCYRKLPDGEWKQMTFKSAIADFEEPDHELEEYYFDGSDDKDKRRRVGPAAFMIDNDVKTAWRSDRGPILRHTESAAVFKLAEPMAMPEGTQLRIQITMKHGGDGNGRDNLLLGRLRVSVRNTSSSERLISHAAALAVQVDAPKRDLQQNSAIFREWRMSLPELADINQRISALEKTYPEASTSVLSLQTPTSEYARETKVFERGEWDKPGRSASPTVLAVLHPLPTPNPDRLAFARWLADEKSPLTARVQVNRIWQAIFGRGLVETSEDFGTRAAIPRYQNVLDTLAVHFMENGWRQKDLIRLILTSDVYAQSSKVSPDAIAIDPYNERLMRGPRFRMEAELIRDAALSVAGILNRQIGGPSFFPPVPQSMLDDNFFKLDYWNEATAPERYRRSLYVFRKRAMPDPVMTSFDAPNSDAACTRRVRSNTPLAALASLNEPVMVEAARAFAMRIVREGGGDDNARIDFAYRSCMSRAATDDEKKTINQALRNQRDRLSDGWLSIREVAFANEATLPELPDGVAPVDVAAWTLVARVIMNLDETICKN
jgi:hypothetical protein